MKAKDAIIAWTGKDDPFPEYPNKGIVEVFRANKAEKVYGHHNWIGSWKVGVEFHGDGRWRMADRNQRIAWIVRAFIKMVTLDGIDPTLAHEELLKIDEYKEWIRS